MASSARFTFPVEGNGGLPRYEEHKEERVMAMVGVTDPSAGSTVIHMHQSQVYVTPPRDHFLWSICSMLYFNFCCLGFMALVFSIKARDRKVVGDYSGATSYGSTAQCLNITALCLSLLTLVLGIILLVVLC
ncbi:interferon-induced transmembrane protein 1-like [Rhineura floridana]|uniref:interferon-induced transmembrane protein 1-like n=1 Tax=Rhineura floridana TaxID=261503 RepID=UPI002AC7EA21|nr:interferon-induced transmembrane protein 1-like [Rhineura floridana]XP_061477169.1 interferon-induced transmembrane protein 1-like [Rhineura floridana]XP_061477170.1 interferon-induced transmembrane protein 1-like [Rhineura floridana]